MSLKKIKPYLALIVVALTIVVFVYYIAKHPEILSQLGKTSPLLLVLLLALYGGVIVALVVIQFATLRLSDLKIGRRDNFLLTMYSTIINFFGPLQSGPGFRGVYLKQRFGVSIKRYTFATLGYYACFAFWSAVFIGTAFNWRWWLLALAIALVALSVVWLTSARRIKIIIQNWKLKNMALLFAATFLQLSIVAVIYYTELRSITPAITFHQAIIYAGAANFALFVSITPGAIGFREAFVLATEKLHHIPQHTILSASLLDRATYIILLGVLFLITLAMHAKARLTPDQSQPAQESDK